MIYLSWSYPTYWHTSCNLLRTKWGKMVKWNPKSSILFGFKIKVKVFSWLTDWLVDWWTDWFEQYSIKSCSWWVGASFNYWYRGATNENVWGIFRVICWFGELLLFAMKKAQKISQLLKSSADTSKPLVCKSCLVL